MRINHIVSISFCLTFVFFVSAQFASAQRKGRDDNRGSRTSGMMQRFDANGDGLLQPSEIPERAKSFVNRASKQAGLDPSKPISIKKLSEALRNSRGRGSDSDRGSRDASRRGSRDERGRRDWRGRGSDRGGSSYKPDTVVTVPGFGEEDLFPPVPGFDVPLAITSNSSELTDEEIEARYGERLLRYIERDILRNHDKNKNGMLDPEEWEGVSWGSDPNKDDTNHDGRLTKTELAVRLARRWGVKPKDSSQSKQGSSGKNSSSGSQRTRSRPEAVESKDSKSDTDRIRSYAKNIVRKHDRNKNGQLDREELKNVNGPASRADFNGDGKVTVEEITQRMQGDVPSKAKTSRSSKRGSRTRRTENNMNESDNSSQSNFSATAPSWFASKDSDKNGQVEMSEYTSRWSTSKIAEFKRYDKNGDGVITLKESSK